MLKQFLLVLLVLAVSADFLPGYVLKEVHQTAWGWEGELTRVSSGPYGGDVDTLKLFLYYQTQDILRVKIFDANNERWEVPDVVQQKSPPTEHVTTTSYYPVFTTSPFGLGIVRKSDNEILWNSTSPQSGTGQFNGLIFEDQYIEWSTQTVSQPNIYGLGERVGTFKLSTDDEDFVMFNRDQGTPPNTNLYGTHPMYMEIRQANGFSSSHGVFFLNSNAMNVHVGDNVLTYQTIGGILDVWFMMGPSPHDVIQQYLSIVGKPHLPPYWELGFHQCRWGYVSIEETASVAFNYEKFEIPLDTMWNDIDYMDAYKDFTNDPIHYPTDEYKEFIDYLHDNGQHYVCIVDPGIMIDPSYSSYQDGLDMGIYIKQNDGIQDAVGNVWPGNTVFPDFSNPKTETYWRDQIRAYRDTGIEIDGMWIDMNEISNFCTGNCFPVNQTEYSLANDPYDNPPFTPTSAPLNTSTISMNAQTYLGVNYNTHDLYAFYEQIVTNKALELLRGERSFVLTRSSFAGSGKYTSHWLGDNTSTWTDLYESIAGILNFQMFGIPMVGADICGFNGNTTVELCSRWMQLGSFYPFSRNHNAIGQIPQEPWAFDSPQHIQITRNSLLMRYLLLPYFYTLAADANENGSTIWNALIWNFPSDPECLSIDSQFMVGSGILVSPALEESQTTVKAYFPAGTWYDFVTGEKQGSPSSGGYVTLDAPITKIPVSIFGGSIIPTQVASLTTTRSRENPFMLKIALDENGNAKGHLYLDDGVSLNPRENMIFSSISYQCQNGTSVFATVNEVGYDTSHLFLNQIEVFGVSNPVTRVFVNGVQTSSNFQYIDQTGILFVSGLVLQMNSPWSIEWV